MKKTLSFIVTSIILSITLFTSCDKKENEKNPATGKTVEIDVASAWGTWNYFSFSTGEIVGTGSATETSDTEWKARTDWDIAFTRLYARTNSGVSGNGNGGAVEISAGNADKANVFTNLTEAPTTGYVTDETTEGLMIGMGGAAGPTTYDAGSNSQINTWLTMAMPIVIAPKVFAIKTADGKYAKIFLKAYQNDEGQSNVIMMEYVYQSDGTTNLSTSN